LGNTPSRHDPVPLDTSSLKCNEQGQLIDEATAKLLADINFWKRSGEHLEPIDAADAVKVFLDAAREDYSNRRTLSDVQQRLRKFAAHFGNRPLHEVTITDLELFLGTYSHGWNRWNTYKRLRPFYNLAKRRQWVPKNLMEEIPKPKTPTPERRIYTPDEFQRLLWQAEPEWDRENPFADLLPYVLLSGFCFLRTAELVAKYGNEQTLQWSDVHEEEIHVRPGVAKGTKSERGDERFAPVHSAARKWLEPFRRSAGPCVPYSAVKFWRLWWALTDAAKVERIPNGLRHSAIS
jgi:integrase